MEVKCKMFYDDVDQQAGMSCKAHFRGDRIQRIIRSIPYILMVLLQGFYLVGAIPAVLDPLGGSQCR